MDSAALPEEVTDLDEYMFVVRARTGKSMESWHISMLRRKIQKKESLSRYSTSM